MVHPFAALLKSILLDTVATVNYHRMLQVHQSAPEIELFLSITTAKSSTRNQQARVFSTAVAVVFEGQVVLARQGNSFGLGEA